MKRVDGLEKRLKDEKKSDSAVEEITSEEPDNAEPEAKRPHIDTSRLPDEFAVYSPPIRYEL